MATSTARAFANDPQAQLRQLRDQVDDLMRDRVTPAMHDAADRASDYARQASDVARVQGKALSGQVKERPLIALLVAAAAGYLVGRLTG